MFTVLTGWLSWQIWFVAARPWTGLVPGRDGALAFATAGGGSPTVSVSTVAMLIAGLFAGFGYVEDRVTGRTPYLMVRGVSRRQHLLARIVAPAVAAGATIGGAGLIAMGYGQLTLPPGPIRVESLGVPGEANPTAMEFAPPPVPELFVTSPILHDLVWSAGAALFVFGLCCVAGAVGAVVSSRLLVVVAPILFVLAASTVLPDVADPVNPALLMPIAPDGPWQVAFGYWMVVGLVALVAADQVARRRELV